MAMVNYLSVLNRIRRRPLAGDVVVDIVLIGLFCNVAGLSPALQSCAARKFQSGLLPQVSERAPDAAICDYSEVPQAYADAQAHWKL